MFSWFLIVLAQSNNNPRVDILYYPNSKPTRICPLCLMLRPWVSQGKRQEALPILYFTFAI